MPINIKHTDAFTLLKSLPDNSVDLIATDPPYYRVRKDDWDNQWKTEADFLEWCQQLAVEFKRVLKDNGSLYWFAGDKLASRIEIEVRKHLTVKNHIVWYKPTGRHKCTCKRMQRKYFGASERVIFAVAVDNEKKETNKSYSNACEPLIRYFREALNKSDFNQTDINRHLKKQMSGHWFGRSQWQLPSGNDYKKLQKLLPQLTRSYESLVKERDLLLSKKHHAYSRIFNVDKSTFNTDVWICNPVQYYEGKHTCEKPSELMEHIINASSRPGDLVLDPFVGSGSTAIAAKKLGRDFIGCELDKNYADRARESIRKQQYIVMA